MTYRIDKNKKIPPVKTEQGDGKAGRARATMEMLVVGDSFFVREPLDAVKATKAMRDYHGTHRDAPRPKRFTSRKEKDGVRIWRVK
jgi:hypothetical protein